MDGIGLGQKHFAIWKKRDDQSNNEDSEMGVKIKPVTILLPLLNIFCGVTCWSLRSIITTNKRSIDFRQSLTAILQRLSHIMGMLQRSSLIEQNIDLNPDSISSMIRSD
jgi:hypothetical protein